MSETDYSHLSGAQLARMLAYAANELVAAPETLLREVREDMEDAALSLLPAAEHVEERRAAFGAKRVPPARFLGPDSIV